MKYLFIGLGSIGMRHLQNLRELTDEPIYALRTKVDTYVDEQFKIKSIESLQEAIDIKPDVVFITNPTSKHISYAMMFSDCHLFIEKPIATDNCYLEKLLDEIEKQHKICFVGYNYRFHPNLIQIKKFLDEKKIGKIMYATLQSGQYLPDWHPKEDYRKSYAARKDLGGGVILTSSHDIDYAYWLFGELKILYKLSIKKSSLDIDVEDVLEVIFETKDKAIIKLHIDYLQRPATRTIEIVGDKGKITWDYYKNEVCLFKDKEHKWTSFVNSYFDRNDMYMEELRHFLKCVEGKETPKITHKDITDVMEIIVNVKK